MSEMGKGEEIKLGFEERYLESMQVSKNVEECLRYELKPGNTGHKINTTRTLIGKMLLFLWLL